MEWYYSQNEQTVGPFDGATLQKLIKAGVISSETLVFNAQLVGWVRLADCMPPPESPQPPEFPKRDTQVPRASENSKEQKFPRKALYAVACMVMIFVTPSLTRRHSILICCLTLAFAFAAVELCHLARRDVRLGVAGGRYKRSLAVVLVFSYVLLALSLIPFLVALINSLSWPRHFMQKLNLIESFIVAGVGLLSSIWLGYSYYTLIPMGVAYLVIQWIKVKKEFPEKHPNAGRISPPANENLKTTPGGAASIESRLAKIETLKASGTITESEYRDQRSKVLSEL
jgi:hypothetical protein